jgi:hypothetical protein
MREKRVQGLKTSAASTRVTLRVEKKEKKVQGFEPCPHEVENEIIDLTLFFGL